jgi:hypothetical protein
MNYLLLVGFLDHLIEDGFKGHDVRANTVGLKIGTGALPLTVLILYGVIVIFTLKRCFQGFEGNSFAFFSITLGFLNLTDQSAIHHVNYLRFTQIFKMKTRTLAKGVFLQFEAAWKDHPRS